MPPIRAALSTESDGSGSVGTGTVATMAVAFVTCVEFDEMTSDDNV